MCDLGVLEEVTSNRATGDYVYPWLACLLLLVVYSLLFFRLRGWVSVTPDRWSRIRFRRGSSNRLTQGEFGRAIEDNGESGIGTLIGRQKASKMLWYPVCYIVSIDSLLVYRHANQNIFPCRFSSSRCRSFDGSISPTITTLRHSF